MTSRILETPVRYMMIRSKPRPYPACFVPPYFRQVEVPPVILFLGEIQLLHALGEQNVKALLTLASADYLADARGQGGP